MGFFSSKKEEKKVSTAPAAPPAPAAAPAPSVSNSSPDVSNVGNLAPPSIPGSSHLDDIKSEVASSAGSISTEGVSSENGIASEQQHPSSLADSSDLSLNSDSLFDLSDLDLVPGVEEKSIASSQSNSSDVEVSSERVIPIAQSDVIDTNTENLSSLSFASRSGVSRSKDEDIFVTTSQFKSLLSIIDSVKARVKEATETHLRLMDIKSEEDIEYENLRKSFQYVEDKLYEVDNLIFEK